MTKEQWVEQAARIMETESEFLADSVAGHTLRRCLGAVYPLVQQAVAAERERVLEWIIIRAMKYQRLNFPQRTPDYTLFIAVRDIEKGRDA